MTDFKPISVARCGFTSDPAPDSGASRRVVAFVYTLEPRRTGSLTIGSVRLVCEGATYETQPIAVRVVPAGESVPPPVRWPRTNGVELVCTIDRTSVFVGEQVQVAYRLFSRTRVGGVMIKDVPAFNGFWTAEVIDVGDLKWLPTKRGGQPCSVAVVRRATLLPVQPGQLAVGRMTLAGVVAEPGGLFRGMQTPFTVSSVPLNVTARPLPDSGRPVDFAGGVGQFCMSSKLSGNRTRNGEPLTLEVTVSGTGNTGTIGVPKVHVADGVKLPAPIVEQQASRQGGRVRGAATFTYSIIPRADGLNIVPPASMSFFDPEGDTYYTLETEPTAYVAAAAASTDTGQSGTDIRHIKSCFSAVPSPLADTWWTALFYPTGTIVFLAGVFVSRHRRRLESDRGYALRFRAGRAVRKRLKESERSLALGDRRGYYAALANAVVGYAGDRFNIEVRGLPASDLRDALCQRGVDPMVADLVIEFSSRCDVARFSPGAGAFSPQEALSSARRVIGIL
jgi:hypothetical protein